MELKKKILFCFAFDSVFWLALWQVISAGAYARYAENYIVFVITTLSILFILGVLLSKDDKFQKEVREKDKTYPVWFRGYVITSPFIEALALATIGFTGTATLWVIVAIIMGGIRMKDDE